MDEYVLVVAGTFEEYERWRYENPNVRHVAYAHDARALRGRIFDRIVYVGTWQNRPDRHEIDEYIGRFLLPFGRTGRMTIMVHDDYAYEQRPNDNAGWVNMRVGGPLDRDLDRMLNGLLVESAAGGIDVADRASDLTVVHGSHACLNEAGNPSDVEGSILYVAAQDYHWCAQCDAEIDSATCGVCQTIANLNGSCHDPDCEYEDREHGTCAMCLKHRSGNFATTFTTTPVGETVVITKAMLEHTWNRIRNPPHEKRHRQIEKALNFQHMYGMDATTFADADRRLIRDR